MKLFPHYVQLDAMDCAPMRLWISAKYESKSHSINIRYMKHFLSLILLATSCSLSATAQPAAQTAGAGFLWRISGNGLKSDSYVVGTNHLMPVSLLDNTKGFANVWRKVSQVAAECDLLPIVDLFTTGHIDEKYKSFGIPKETIAKTTSGKKYSDLYTGSQLQYMKRLLGSSLYPSLSADDMPPLNLCEKIYTHKKSNKSVGNFSIASNILGAMDIALAARSRTDRKRYFGMEGQTEGLTPFPKRDSLFYASFTIEEQAEILYREVKYQTAHPNRVSYESLMEKYYKERNFFGMEKVYANRQKYIDSLGLSDSLARKLRECDREAGRIVVENRTRNWMSRILSEIQSAPTLIDVGAEHLLGKEGLINLLRENGYTVEPVM